MPMPDPTTTAWVCMLCEAWQIDAPPRARASFGLKGLAWAMAEIAHAHQQEAHPNSFGNPLTYRGAPLVLADGVPATGALIGIVLPRWWDWINVKGNR